MNFNKFRKCCLASASLPNSTTLCDTQVVSDVSDVKLYCHVSSTASASHTASDTQVVSEVSDGKLYYQISSVASASHTNTQGVSGMNTISRDVSRVSYPVNTASCVVSTVSQVSHERAAALPANKGETGSSHLFV